MHIVLLAAAAGAVIAVTAGAATPAQAEVTSLTARPAPSVHGVFVHRGFGSGHGDGRHHRHGRFGDGVVVGSWYDGGEWALYNNRSWEPDSYNDWWHDRPDRAYPRWMSHNQDCERLWWSGGGWRC